MQLMLIQYCMSDTFGLDQAMSAETLRSMMEVIDL